MVYGCMIGMYWVLGLYNLGGMGCTLGYTDIKDREGCFASVLDYGYGNGFPIRFCTFLI